MKRYARSSTVNKILLSALALGALALTPLACSSPADPVGPGSSVDSGSVEMGLTLSGGAQISTISWTITGPNGASTVVQTGSLDVSNSQAISFLVGGIPTGNNYSISLSGTSTDGNTTCAGSASFNVTARTTTNVTVSLQCNSGVPDAGSVVVHGNPYECATVSSLAASPLDVIVGKSVTLSATATGPNPAAITYQWSAPSGSFDNATVASPHFTCSTTGTVPVTVTVTDGAVPDGGMCNAALSTSTVSIVCDPDPLATDIQTIVVIYAENRTFDSLFGNYPGARGLSEVVSSSGTPTAAYIPQKDRDGTTVLSKLPQTWGGATAAGNPTVVTQAQTDNLANAPFSIETGFTVNGGAMLTTLDVTRDMAHRFFENTMEINGGTNDMFAAWLDAGGLTMGHFNYASSQLFALATQYVVADNFFEGAFGGSFLNHQYLICACAPTVPNSYITTNNPSVNVLGTPNAKGVPQLAVNASSPASALTGPPSLQTGNIAPLNYFGPGDGYRAVNTMQPPYQPSGNSPVSGASDLRYAAPLAATTLPPQSQSTIGDLLSAHGIGWAWYATSWNAAVTDGSQPSGTPRTVIYTPSTPRGNPDFQAHHHPFNYYAAFDPAMQAANRAAHLKDYNDLLNDVAAGTVPPVAFYKPTGYVNQHPGYANITDGDAHITGLVNTLKAGPQWNHMVIVITYDEYGGQWDHVAPPTGDLLGPGTRIPAIIISPYAKAGGTVDHTQYDTASILRLITRRFSLSTLPGLAARDAALVSHGGTAMGDLTNALTLP